MRHLIAAAAFLASAAHAQTVGLHLGSWHSEPGYNNANPGVYVRLENGLTAGAYRNSFRKTSVYAGWTWQADIAGFRPAITAGLISGYRHPFLVVPSIAAPEIGSVRLRVAYVPRLDPKGAHVIHLMAEKEF